VDQVSRGWLQTVARCRSATIPRIAGPSQGTSRPAVVHAIANRCRSTGKATAGS